MSLLTSGGKSLGIDSDCTIDDKGHTHSKINESGYKHGSFRGRGRGSCGLSANACAWVNFARFLVTLG